MNASTTKASPDRRTMVQEDNSVGENMKYPVRHKQRTGEEGHGAIQSYCSYLSRNCNNFFLLTYYSWVTNSSKRVLRMIYATNKLHLLLLCSLTSRRHLFWTFKLSSISPLNIMSSFKPSFNVCVVFSLLGNGKSAAVHCFSTLCETIPAQPCISQFRLYSLYSNMVSLLAS